MTAPPYGPSRTGQFKEIRELHERIDALQGAFDTALQLLTEAVRQRVDDELGVLGDVHERMARLEDILDPLTVDPTAPEVEWSYRRGDGILRPAPADPDERLQMITAGTKLIPVIRNTREDGRLPVVPPPEMASNR